MKNKKIIIIVNIVMICVFILIYFLLKNRTYTIYTHDYDEYMYWKIENEATKIGEIYNTEIYIKDLGREGNHNFEIYYLYGDNEYSILYCTGVHDGVNNGDYVLAKLDKNMNWKKFNIKNMYFAYDKWWGNEVELHIQTNDGKFHIFSPAYKESTYHNYKNLYKKIMDNSNLDISNLKK